MDLNKLYKINETTVCLQLFTARAMPSVLLGLFSVQLVFLSIFGGFNKNNSFVEHQESEHAQQSDNCSAEHLSGVIFKRTKIVLLRLDSAGFWF